MIATKTVSFGKMKFIIATLLFVACAQARILPSDSMLRTVDFQKGIDTRIISGEDATLGMFPWQAGLLITTTSGQMHMCGGSLLSDKWILTAAHCVDGAKTIKIQMGGVTFFVRMSYVETTTQFIIHEAYDKGKHYNDIALIPLPKPVTFSPNIQPIQLPTSNYPEVAGQTLVVSGFGQTNSGNLAFKLKYVEVTGITNSECRVTYPGLIDSHICAVGHPEHSPCSGDSGGPLVHFNPTPTLLGVTSFVHGDKCDDGYPSAYARVDKYLTWIYKHTGI